MYSWSGCMLSHNITPHASRLRGVVILCRLAGKGGGEGLMQDANAINSAVYHGGLVQKGACTTSGGVPAGG